MEDEAMARFQPAPLTRVVAGYDPDVEATPELQRDLASDDISFEDIRQDRFEDVPRGQEREQRIAQEGFSEQMDPEMERRRAIAGRRAELEALGMDDMLVSPMVPGQPESLEKQPRFLDVEPERMEPETEEKKAPSKSLLPPEMKYKGEVIRKSMKIQKPFTENNKPDYATVVEGLFSPEPGLPEEKVDELLQNAWDEITSQFSEDREMMQDAHAYLIYLDKQRESAKKPK